MCCGGDARLEAVDCRLSVCRSWCFNADYGVGEL
jgi:hypothetical protein